VAFLISYCPGWLVVGAGWGLEVTDFGLRALVTTCQHMSEEPLERLATGCWLLAAGCGAIYIIEGPAKKKSTDPPVHLLNPRPTHPPTIRLFFSTFLGVSRQGEFKNTIKIFLQKVHVENFSQNFDKIFRCQFFDVSFSSTFFVLSRFRVFLSDGSSKAL
jgi:hypothetical protein